MSVYKYFSIESAHRFLSTWALRITPPDQFNDPFEMCPPIQIIKEEDIFSPDILREEFRRMVRDLLPGEEQNSTVSSFANTFCACLLDKLNAKEERRFLNKYPQLKSQLPALRNHLKMIVEQGRKEFPMLTERLESTMHKSIRDLMGALCMSLNGRHPLMWAHYAQEHRGLVIEFDEAAPCFNRRHSDNDELGSFRKVLYSATRPVLDSDAGDDWFKRLALTKAIEWAYEEEVRFLGMLSTADRMVGEGIHLLNIPPSALRSITLGCRADNTTANMVKKTLGENHAASHIALFRAEVDQKNFALNYVALDVD